MINLSKKIIAFDLDGTLAESKSQMTDEMASLIIELLKEKMVVIISGGSLDQFKKQFLPSLAKKKEYKFFVKNLILLPTSGSQRYEFDKISGDFMLTDMEPLDDNLKVKVISLLNEVINSDLYQIPKNRKGEYIEDRLTQISFSALGQDALYQDKKVWDTDQQKRQKIKSFLDPLLPDLTINIGGTTTIDILAKNFDKAKGLNRLLNKLGMSISDMIFVGDSIFPGGNDYSPYLNGIESINVSGPAETISLIKKWIVN